MLGRQRRTKIAVTLNVAGQHFLFESRWPGPPAGLAAQTMGQSSIAALPVTTPDPLGLPVTYAHQLRRFLEPKITALNPAHPPRTLPLHHAHPQKLHPPSNRQGDILNELMRGHSHCGRTARICLKTKAKICRDAKKDRPVH